MTYTRGPSIRRAEAIGRLQQSVLMTYFADPESAASLIVNVLFRNAKHALSPEDGLTREEVVDQVNDFLETVLQIPNRMITPDALTREIPRIGRRIRQFARWLPLSGIRAITGPTHESRSDGVHRLWFDIDYAEETPEFNSLSPESTGLREMDILHADLVVELVAAFSMRYLDAHDRALERRAHGARLLRELLHICAREARHRRGIAAITASERELQVLWRSIAPSDADAGSNAPIDIGAELARLAQLLRADEGWTRRDHVPPDAFLMFDAELRWRYSAAHGGRFELWWRFWKVFNGVRCGELTTTRDLEVARPISQIPLVQAPEPATFSDDPDGGDDPVLTSLATAMYQYMAKRRDPRAIGLLQTLHELAIRIVARFRRQSRAAIHEHTADVIGIHRRDAVQIGTASIAITMTDGALALTVLAGSIAPARERRPAAITPVDDSPQDTSSDERESAIEYFRRANADAATRIFALADHMLPEEALRAQIAETVQLGTLVRVAAASSCTELAVLGVVTYPRAFLLACYMENIQEWRTEDAAADAGGSNPNIDALRRARLEGLGLEDMLYRRATTLSSSAARLPAAAALAAAGRAVVRYLRRDVPMEFNLARKLDGYLRVIARILEQYRAVGVVSDRTHGGRR